MFKKLCVFIEPSGVCIYVYDVQGRIRREKYLRKACQLWEYLNGGRPVTACVNSHANALPKDLPKDLREENFAQEFPMCTFMKQEERQVIIPARLKGEEEEEEMEDGVIDLGELLDIRNLRQNNESSRVQGSTIFRIPDAEWLVKHGWISEEERDEGPFFVKEFLIFPPPYGQMQR